VTEDSKVLDAPITFHLGPGDTWTPKDDSHYLGYRVSLREAMAQSINVPAVRVMSLVKPPTVVQYARLMGIKSPLDPVLSLALGSSAVTPLEMVEAYATFPNGGNHVEPISFTAVQNSDGEILDTISTSRPTKVLSGETNTQVDDMLHAVTTEGTAASVSRDPAVPEARGKTGTTQDHRDAWFIGYTPRLVCGVWAGHPTVNKHGDPLYGQPMAGNAWGATLCVPIWKNFMLKAEPIFIKAHEREAALWKASHKGAANAKPDQAANDDNQKRDTQSTDRPKRRHKREDFITRNSDGTVTVNIDNDTGLIAPPGSPNSQPINFASGQEPQQMAPQYADQMEGTNQTSSKPHAPRQDSTPDPTASTADPSTTPAAGTGDDSTDGTSTSPDTTNSAAPTDDGSSPTVTSSPITDNGDGGGSPTTDQAPAPPVERPRHHPRPHVEKPKEYVTVYINPDDGLLATKWTPEKVPRTYLKGTEPHRYTTMYPPPPGEQ